MRLLANLLANRKRELDEELQSHLHMAGKFCEKTYIDYQMRTRSAASR
jgi:hypothetical protein